MPRKKQAKSSRFPKKAILVIVLAVAFSMLEPISPKILLAINLPDKPNIDTTNQLKTNYVPDPAPLTAPQKSHAPEPSSIFLFLSGLVSAIVRFAQKSFRKFKRLLDILLAAFGLLIASPVLIIVTLLIKITSQGPVIYRQNRVGEKGKIFGIYKLRTMIVDAERKTGAVWAKQNDPRITAIGKILRKSHVDEIPQLLNVIKGEMSIVGPRPERPEMVKDFKTLILDYEKRLAVKPGITGLAQVWHKYDETIADVKKKVKYDLLYIKKMCLFADLRIIAGTFVVVLTGRGAR